MMRILPRSLSGRLMVTACAATVVALLLATVSIGHVLERFVIHGLDERLDAQILMVGKAVKPDGSLDTHRLVDVPPFDEVGSGWAWEVIAPAVKLKSASLGASDLLRAIVSPNAPPVPPPPDRDHPGPPGTGMAIRPIDGIDAQGKVFHGRLATIPTQAGNVLIVTVAPRDIVERPLRAATTPLLVSLLLLAVFLVAALLVQLRVGLRPLRQLRTMVEEARDGRRSQIEVNEPTELLPLVEELNALIHANGQAIARARGHVANLAHSLKTPLATLRLELAASSEGELRDHLLSLADRMQHQIRHHLGRARASETGMAGTPPILLVPVVVDLIAVMERIHADRPLKVATDIDPDIAVRCDPQDLDELLGNILDNGWRHGRSKIAVTAEPASPNVRIRIADDGPGMTEDEIAIALMKGRRLDEREGGHGFGLPISLELAELHGGAIEIRPRSVSPGGLEVVVTLPRADRN